MYRMNPAGSLQLPANLHNHFNIKKFYLNSITVKFSLVAFTLFVMLWFPQGVAAMHVFQLWMEKQEENTSDWRTLIDELNRRSFNVTYVFSLSSPDNPSH